MVKKRIYELAKELGISSERVIEIAKKYNFKVTNHMSALDEKEQNKIRGSKKQKKKSTYNIIKIKIIFIPKRYKKVVQGVKTKIIIRMCIKIIESDLVVV